MNLKDLTLSNISNFLTGYSSWMLDNFGILPKYIQEQILYRLSQCPPECKRDNSCVGCGCSYPQKLYTVKACNPNVVLPDLMEKEEWEEYKKKNLNK